MPKTHASRMVATGALLFGVAVLLIHGCSEQPTEPFGIEAAGTTVRYPVTLLGTGSTASGKLTWPSTLVCTVTYASGVVTTSGSCVRDVRVNHPIIITATPPAGGSVQWTGCDAPITANPLECRVVVTTGPRTITAAFAPPPNSFLLTVQGGSNGNGSVQSNPTGISCNISNGSASGTCSGAYTASTEVTLSASASTGSHLKAWAGGGCETTGTGMGTGQGSCTVTMSQARTIIVSFEVDAPPPPPPGGGQGEGKWDPPFDWPMVAIHAALLPSGKALTYGRLATGHPVVWDPATPTLFSHLTNPVDLFCSGQTFLSDGRLLVTGGHSGIDGQGIKTSYYLDYNSNTWIRGTDMRNGRWYPTQTALANGEMLTISGGDTVGVTNSIPEVLQTNGTWRSLTNAIRSVPWYPMMFVAPDGRLVMVGPNRAGLYLNTAGTGLWNTGPTSNFGTDPGARDYGSAVMYEPGKILIVGGNQSAPTKTAEVIDLNHGMFPFPPWQYTGSMAVGRRQLSATLLADGRVLATGGSNAPGFNTAPTDSRVLAAEIWDPTTGQWTASTRMAHNRLYHSNALLLPDARVLSVGSGEPPASGQTNDFTGEIYSPPYLFNSDGSPATRPTIASAPTGITYGQTFTVGTPDAGSISKVTFIAISSVTHSFNMNQRMNLLSSTVASPTSLSLVAPPSPNAAPPGYYLLFILNGQGVPSVARIIRIQ